MLLHASLRTDIEQDSGKIFSISTFVLVSYMLKCIIVSFVVSVVTLS